MKKTLLAISLLLALFCQAQIMNVTEIEINFSGASKPQSFTKGTTKIYFSANDGVNGQELWAYDSLTNETYMVKDIKPGSNNGIDRPQFITIGDILYFTPNIYSSGTQLWRSDGTENGTYMVKNIANGSYNTIANLTNFNGTLFFSANDGINGNEIWISDGTDAGTMLLKDINTTNSFGSSPSNFAVCNGALFFTANDAINGNEIWKTDGTTVGTSMIKNIDGNSGSSIYTTRLIPFNNIVYFYAATTTNGYELWKTDGTAIGTELVKDIFPGTESSNQSLVGIETNGYFVFVAFTTENGYELWKSDGTMVGTTLLRDIHTGTNSSVNENTQFASLNGKIYFTANDNVHGVELWSTDGTTAGTQIVKDIYTGAFSSSIYTLSAVNNYLLFSATDGTHTYKTIWKSDGTDAGTFELKDVNMNQDTSTKLSFVSFNNTVFFPAGYNSVNGVELWTTDGTTQNTAVYKDIFHIYSGITNFDDSAQLGNNLICNGNTGNGATRPFITDGTIVGTRIISDTAPGGSSYTKAGNYVFYRSSNGTNGYELWKTDGTAGNTAMVKDIKTGSGSSLTEYTFFMEFNDILYFKADDGIHGEELWRSDGTETGTYMLKDINPGSAHSFNGESNIYQNSFTTLNEKGYAILNGYLYFANQDGTDSSIWRTDGTEAGTTKAITIPASGIYDNRRMVINGTQNKIFFKTNSNNSTYSNNALWSSDGTQSGTVMVYQTPITGYVHFKKNIIHNGSIYFNTFNNNGQALMKSDGTVAGTSVVVGSLTDYPIFNSMISCGSYVYFGLGNQGLKASKELWRTNGTTSGTVMLENLASSSSVGDYFYGCQTCINQNVVFKKIDINDNKIYYVNDNTNNANSFLTTTIVNAEEFNERGYSMYNYFYNLNNKLLFTAAKEYNGYELYSGDFDFDTLNVGSVETNLRNTITLYPNPAKNNINISPYNNEIVLNATVYDLLGKNIFSSAVVNNQLDISVIGNGIYIIKIFTDKSQYNSKIIIKK